MPPVEVSQSVPVRANREIRSASPKSYVPFGQSTNVPCVFIGGRAMEGALTMSGKDQVRLKVIEAVREKRPKQSNTALQPGLGAASQAASTRIYHSRQFRW